MLTIGKLAKLVGLRTSALRYYEAEGLLVPNGRSDSGYRLYKPEAAQRLHLIQRAQRLGFSLVDIRTLLDAWDTGHLSNTALLDTAENRYLALEGQVTRLLILQHELERFLQDLQGRQQQPEEDAADSFAELLTHVCTNPLTHPSSVSIPDWLLTRANCQLTSAEGRTVIEQLRGQHVHIWQEGETYHILVVSRETAVADALQQLADLEANCEAHPQTTHQLINNEEGYLLTAKGPNAFIFARLFLGIGD